MCRAFHSFRSEAFPDAYSRKPLRLSWTFSEATFVVSGFVGALFHAATRPGRVIAIAAATGTLPRRQVEMVALAATVPVLNSRDAAVADATNAPR